MSDQDRRRTRSSIPVPGAPHGTSVGYQKFGCGCDDCREWRRIATSKYLSGAGRVGVLRRQLARLERTAERARIRAEATRAEIENIEGQP